MSHPKSVKKSQAVSEKSRRHFKYRGNTCLNCGQPLDLSDVYCPYCSQLNSTKPLSLKDFVGEFFNSIVSYDSRLRYTVVDLLFRPGRITKNYTDGQRLKYANPFRFFLSVSIIYFILFGLINTYITDNGAKFNSAFYDNSLNETEEDGELKKETVDIAGIPSIKFRQAPEDSTQSQTNSIREEESTYISKEGLDTLSWGQQNVEKIKTYYTFYEDTEIVSPSIALDSLGHPPTRYNKWLYERNLSFERIKKNPYQFANYMMGKTPFFLFFFAPIFALFFWLFYFKSSYTYMEHLVFIFHIFSFVFIALFIASLVETVINTNIPSAALFLAIGPFYFYKSLRNFYRQNRFITILKFLLLNFVFLTGASVFAGLFFLITAAVY